MSYARRVLLLLAAVAGAGLAATAASAEPPARGAGPPRLVGTYQRIAKDMVEPDGTLRDVYEDRLVTGGTSYRLRLPHGTDLQGGTPVRVTGRLAGADLQVEQVERLGQAAAPPTTGTTKVLVILAYWTAPDSVTTAQAKSQVFGDDNGWFKEASYGQLSLTGTATPWYQITAPTGGRCFENHMEIMNRAKAKALADGYDPAAYGRVIVYFPRCGGDAAGAAGWAYQPGTEVWLNGYMDRRVSVHEQGHNYGLAHAHTYHCASGEVATTLTGQCSYVEYGDDYDAMGSSPYAGHFSAPAKDELAWLTGRKRVLSSTATTFTLPPFEVAGATPLAAVASNTVNSRKYWVEYRQPLGYDSDLPLGATGGVLVHLRDPAIPAGGGAFLLDMTPHNEFGDAVIPPGGTWTSPEGVRIAVGAVSASGAVVTVTGGADPPTVPGAPRDVTATPADKAVRLTWDPPVSNGGATITSYVVSASPGGASQVVLSGTSTTVGQLVNGTEYAFTVKAVNSVGTGAASAVAKATPIDQLPSVTLTAPAPGATVSGQVTMTATAAPYPGSGSTVDIVVFEVDGQGVGWDEEAPYEATWYSEESGDGPHTLTATVIDSEWREATSAPVDVTVHTPGPAVAVTAPADGAVVTHDLVTLAATASPAPGGDAAISWVAFELADGTTVGYSAGPEPYTAEWDTTALNGPYQVRARAYDVNGRSGVSAPVSVTFQHPVPSVEITAPAEGATVQGAAVPVTAAALPSPVSGAAIDHVELYADGTTLLAYDAEAPFEATWDTSALSGAHVLTAVVHDVNGRVATSAARAVTVDNPLPTATVTSPADYAVVTGQVALAATAAANPGSGSPIARVVLSVDGGEVADVAAPGPYAATWDATGKPGQHTVVATAYDAAGRAGASAPVTFTVPVPAPTAVFAAPTHGATLPVSDSPVTVTVATAPAAETGEPVDYAQIYANGVELLTEEVPGVGWSAMWWPAPGQQVLSASVWDVTGARGDATDVVVTVADKPSAPTNVVAKAGSNGTATLTWTAPADDGGSPITGYVVSANGVPQQAAASPHVVTGLANGTSYTFTVAAVNAAGTGAASAPSNAVVPGVRTALSIAVTPATVPYGKAVAVSGVLKRLDTGAVLGGRRVQLLSCVPGTLTCSAVTSAVTGTTGKVSFTHAPKAHRDLRLRMLTSSPFVTSTSAAKRVTVAVVVTSAISRASMPLGYTVTVSGKVAPAHAGHRVYLQRLTATGWKNVTYKTQGTTGAASFAVRPAARGTWRYRLWFAGHGDHLAAASPSRAVTVT